ncbi:hypothetical protein TTRE_0000036301 [Trichuris trichiura]|uniref:Uncharacterized protein n=1 Tax=Trichuris trichiura TaxID=36087 RepID=A0A077YWK3_TRITR|nr:hypothetical protein TTRE_0000036301 [Trichuris trichiura]
MKLTLLCLTVGWIEAMGAQGQNVTNKTRTARHIDIDFSHYAGPDSASSLSEAFSTFRDPYTGGQLIPDFDHLGETMDGNPKINCATEQCRGCARIVLQKVRQAVKDGAIQQEAQFLWRSLNLDEAKRDWECDTFVSEKKRPSVCEARIHDKDELVRFIRGLSKPKYKVCSKEEYTEIIKKLKEYPLISMKGNDSGKFVPLKCKEHGFPMPEDTYYMQICPSCDGLLVLEQHYRPNIIRVIKCQENYLPCLDGDNNQLHSQSRRSSDPAEFEEPREFRIAAGTIYEALEGFWNPLTGEKMIPDLIIQHEVFTDGLMENTTNLEVLRDAWLLMDELELANADYRRHCSVDIVSKEDICYPPYEKDKGKGHILDVILKPQQYQCEAKPDKRDKRGSSLEGHFKAMTCEEAGSFVAQSSLLNLCGRCWGVRTMPHKIKPAMINEIRCMDDSGKHKIGKCFERHLKVKVLLKQRKKKNKKPEFYDIDIGVGCEFAIPFESVLQSLVHKPK